jgi:hypothetical protein
MSGLLLNVGAYATCPHGGKLEVVSSNPNVMVCAQPAVTIGDQFLISGCSFTIGVKPQPCVEAKWLNCATRVFINGSPAVLQTSIGVCESIEQIPQGMLTLKLMQTRVSGI